MTFEIRFSYFVTWIKILNITSKEKIEPCLKNWFNQGGYGVIFQAKMDDKKYAIKKLDIDVHSPSRSIQNAMK